MIEFHSEQAGGYVDLGLKMTPEKTKLFAASLIRSEMMGSTSSVRSARKTAQVLLLHFGFDSDWVRDEFLPQFEEELCEEYKK